jgi:hypothetical protein
MPVTPHWKRLNNAMQTQIITKRDDLLIRRLVLEPGEAMPWHQDTCHRFSVVVRGDQLSIEMRDTGERKTFAVHSGLAEWDHPQPRVHRGVNSGTSTYEEVVLFFLDPPTVDPQPGER